MSVKNINNNAIWLYKSFDFKHGFGWFCQVYNNRGDIGFGFSKNKFTAYRLAHLDLKNNLK